LLNSHEPIGRLAALVHATLAYAILEQARALRAACGVSRLGLAGGVFQNRLLCEQAAELAADDGFEVCIPLALPCNDAAISFGQLVEAAVL
jgi:hydrogenase maturation protein HypF